MDDETLEFVEQLATIKDTRALLNALSTALKKHLRHPAIVATLVRLSSAKTLSDRRSIVNLLSLAAREKNSLREARPFLERSALDERLMMGAVGALIADDMNEQDWASMRDRLHHPQQTKGVLFALYGLARYRGIGMPQLHLDLAEVIERNSEAKSRALSVCEQLAHIEPIDALLPLLRTTILVSEKDARLTATMAIGEAAARSDVSLCVDALALATDDKYRNKVSYARTRDHAQRALAMTLTSSTAENTVAAWRAAKTANLRKKAAWIDGYALTCQGRADLLLAAYERSKAGERSASLIGSLTAIPIDPNYFYVDHDATRVERLTQMLPASLTLLMRASGESEPQIVEAVACAVGMLARMTYHAAEKAVIVGAVSRIERDENGFHQKLMHLLQNVTSKQFASRDRIGF